MIPCSPEYDNVFETTGERLKLCGVGRIITRHVVRRDEGDFNVVVSDKGIDHLLEKLWISPDPRRMDLLSDETHVDVNHLFPKNGA